MPDGQVRSRVVKARNGGSRLEAQSNTRMRGDEAWQTRQQPTVGHRVKRRDLHARSVLGDTIQRNSNRIDIRQCRIGRISQSPAFFGQRYAAGVALKQFDAEGCFEAADMMADGAGRQSQLLGRVREILMSCRDGEYAERGQGSRSKGHWQGLLRVSPGRQTQIKFVSDQSSMPLLAPREQPQLPARFSTHK